MKKLVFILVLGFLVSCSANPAVVPTSQPSPTPKPELPTATSASEYPTYSEVIAAYPAGTTLSKTDISVTNVDASGKWTFSGGSISSCGGDPFFKCYGVKITIKDKDIAIDGKMYPAGSKLTVDKDMEWIQVSSWE